MPAIYNAFHDYVVLQPDGTGPLGCRLRLPEAPEEADGMVLAYRAFVKHPFTEDLNGNLNFPSIDVNSTTFVSEHRPWSHVFYMGLSFSTSFPNISANDDYHPNFVGFITSNPTQDPIFYNHVGFRNIIRNSSISNFCPLFAPTSADAYGCHFSADAGGGESTNLINFHVTGQNIIANNTIIGQNFINSNSYDFIALLQQGATESALCWLLPVSTMHNLTSYGVCYPWTIYWRFTKQGNTQINISFGASRDPIIRGKHTNLFAPLLTNSINLSTTRWFAQGAVEGGTLWRPSSTTINFPQWFLVRWPPYHPFHSAGGLTESLALYIDRISVMYITQQI